MAEAQARVEPPQTVEALAAMRRGLLRARGSFALYVAVSNSPRRSRELIRMLADAVPGIEVVELAPGVEDPLAAVVDRAEPEESGPLMVLGLERSLSTDEETAPLLRVLNMQRERWPRALRRPVVLWVPEFLLELLGRSAPDFLDWRSGTFFFVEEDRAEGAGSLLRSMDAAVWKGGLDEGLPLADRRRRIDELRSRLASTAETSDRVVLAARARWLHELGIHLWRLGEWNEAELHLREAVALADEVNNPAGRAAVYHQLGILAHERGAYDDALDWYRKSLAIKEELGAHAGFASSYHQLGLVAQARGAYDEALDWYRKSLAILEAFDDCAGMVISYHQLGRVAEERGAYDEALVWYRKSLEIAEDLGDRDGMASSYHQLGILAQARGAYDEALDWYRKSLAIAEELGDRDGMASSYHQLGTVAQKRGAYGEAFDWYRKSLQILEELGDRVGMPSALGQIGSLITEQGEPEKGLPFNLRSLMLGLELRAPQAITTNLYWLRRQRDLLGDERFQAIIEREGTVDPDLLARLLLETEPDDAPQPAPATA